MEKKKSGEEEGGRGADNQKKEGKRVASLEPSTSKSVDQVISIVQGCEQLADNHGLLFPRPGSNLIYWVLNIDILQYKSCQA